MMKVMKIIFIIAITMALSITIIMKNIENEEEKPPFKHTNTLETWSKAKGLPLHEKKYFIPSKRVSRFLAEQKNPRAADHCNKDNDICNTEVQGRGGRNSTCCNNKCMDLTTDHKNCGACKNKCAYTEACCRGECVSLAYDKRHCGACNNRCMPGGYCIYGMCDYA